MNNYPNSISARIGPLLIIKVPFTTNDGRKKDTPNINTNKARFTPLNNVNPLCPLYIEHVPLFILEKQKKNVMKNHLFSLWIREKMKQYLLTCKDSSCTLYFILLYIDDMINLYDLMSVNNNGYEFNCRSVFRSL